MASAEGDMQEPEFEILEEVTEGSLCSLPRPRGLLILCTLLDCEASGFNWFINTVPCLIGQYNGRMMTIASRVVLIGSRRRGEL